MTSLSGIGVPAPGAATGASAANRFAEMTAEDFTRIIFTELSNQDPLAPNDSGALLQQLSSLRSIQSDMMLAERLQTIVSQNELASASGLIGRTISGLAEDGSRAIGIVRAVSRTKDGVVLTVGEAGAGKRVPMSSVDRIEPNADAHSVGGQDR